VSKLEKACAPVEELEKLGIGRLRQAMVEGDTQYGTVACGQIAGMVKEIKPVREILMEIMEGAEAVLHNLGVK